MFHRSAARIQPLLRHLSMTSSSMSTSAASGDVLLQKVGMTGVISLNRPKALNALNLQMIRTMYPQLVEWEQSSEVNLVLMKGLGGKAFCAGGDIRAVTEAAKIGDRLSRDFFKEEYILNNAIGTMTTPYVALIHGITMGGGVGLSVHGRYRIATERTLFAMPETAIGLFPDVGGGWFLPKLKGQLGAFLCLTGYRLKGRDVVHAGVATHMIDSSKLEELESSLVELETPSQENIAAVLDRFHAQCVTDQDTPFSLDDHLDDINTHFSHNSMEDIFQSLEGAKTDWATKQLDILKKMSPTSMKISLRLLREGARNTSLAQTLETEYRLSQRCAEGKDFTEGVRAVLVDKDQTPVWNPPTLQGVTPSIVEDYFSPFDDNLRELVLT